MARGLRWQKSSPLLCLEWVWFLVSLLPQILYAFFTRLLPAKGKSLDGKVVLVTGAAEGLGRELALVFAREGCQVACVDTDQTEVLETAAEIIRDGEKARGYTVDLAVADEVRALRESVTKDLGSVDVLVSCCSPEYVKRLEDTAETTVKDILNINLLGPVWLMREFLPEMKVRDSGHVVIVSSAAAHCPLANAALYAASQSAVAGLIESLRQEVLDEGYEGIHFTTVFPAFLKSSRNKSIFNFWQRVSSQHVEVVAVTTLTAVKTNTPTLYLPEYLYWLHSFNKFLPTSMSDWFLGLFNFGKMVKPKTLVDRTHTQKS